MHGQKRNDLISTGKLKHSVLLFGPQLFGKYFNEIKEHPNARIDVLNFPTGYDTMNRLSEYNLVILDYSAFVVDGSHYAKNQEIFEKLMLDALQSGTNFCFVYYDEKVPRFDKYALHTNHMNADDIKTLRKQQLGFNWLSYSNIKPIRSEELILDANLKRNEFKLVLEKWGATHNAFMPSSNSSISEIFYLVDDYCLGFSLNIRNGKIIYIPFQRDYSRKEDLLLGIEKLIDSLLTYTVNSYTEKPEWADSPFFPVEVSIISKIDELEKELENEVLKLTPYNDVKSLLLESQYSLEQSIPNFINEKLGLSTFRDEKYLEDFWFLDNDSKKIGICEVKSVIKGFKKGAIFSLFNHREENKLDESFPAILFVNADLQSASWTEKDKPISKQDYEIAAQNNILILRIEDLVRLWFLKENEKIQSSDLLNLFIKNKGWLFVNSELEIKINQ